MKKRLLAILLAAVMVTSMVACGDDSGNNTGDTGNSNSNTGDTNTGDTNTGDTNTGDDQNTPEEPAYDFGGAVIRVSKGQFSDLNPGTDDSNVNNPSYIAAWDAASQIEAKYNVKFEYVELEGQTGYGDTQDVLQGIQNGEAFADIFCFSNDVMIGLRDYLADITADLDVLQIGSLFTEAGTWNGKTYGWTYDNLGGVDVWVYSRDYLKKIGMDVTPTDKFLAGEWSYDDALAYFTELQSKLPTGTYCISIYPNHWSWMASPPNGVIPVDNDGTINLTSEAYISAMNFYRDMLSAGVAYPITGVQVDENGTVTDFDDIPYALSDVCTKDEDKKIVLGICESWQMEGVYDNLGDWGIVPWPWDSEYTTVSGDYTTLSDTYKLAQRFWTNVMIPQAEYRSEGAAAIPDIMLHKIAMDYIDLKDANGGTSRHAMWEAEQSGDTSYQYLGKTPGTIGVFSTMEDASLYDWCHSRVVLNHAYSVSSYVRVSMVGYQSLCVGDPRAAAQSYAASGEAALVEAGLK